ncbi:bifunctional coenzyme A synthase isoform X1 [Pieris rapae]|uniref:bifunctional coenzyme A synthase isoform X1 n=2 Tax=Pieris rapae TaxID=64459 RepID=UPI001E27DF1A|nr:bifunctional coenzyme A synthase isoform X1 [Pieris rapae]
MCNSLLSVAIAVVLLSISLSYYFTKMNSNTDLMASNALLFVSNTAKTLKLCLKSSRLVSNILYIKYIGVDNNLSVINKQIIDIYSKTATQNANIDIRLILKPLEGLKKLQINHPIDMILTDSRIENENLKELVSNIRPGCQLQTIGTENEIESIKGEPVKTYEYVALGGTFDRLHHGHKILLSQAALRATKHVTVGVTDINMIQSKILWELIQPVELRIKAVKDFLTDINPDLEYNVLAIQDLYGPTKDDPRFEMIVLSEETYRGGVKINEKRKENGLKELDMHVIELAHDDQHSSEEDSKLSSSNQRMRLLGTMLKPPKPNPNIPLTPYVIGLAGGIASGKSNITEKLKSKGAAIVNCDLIAHELYKPGLPLNRTLAETFGNDIITAAGEIDRKKLGEIVFSDTKKLNQLNQTVWPFIIEEAQNRIKLLGEQGYKVVVMEAAVMIQAKWFQYCHQLWAVIVPPKEAIRRLQERNNLSEEEAKKRVEAQPTNYEQVSEANVVFSPNWSYEFTQQQIDKAWDALQKYL